MKTLSISLLLTAALVWPSTAPTAVSADDFQRVDNNKDGVLSWSEYKSRVMEMLYFSDADNDGHLSRTEASPEDLQRWSQLDVNSDGNVRSTEWVAFHKAWFKQADTNDDGVLSQSEIDAQTKDR